MRGRSLFFSSSPRKKRIMQNARQIRSLRLQFSTNGSVWSSARHERDYYRPPGRTSPTEEEVAELSSWALDLVHNIVAHGVRTRAIEAVSCRYSHDGTAREVDEAFELSLRQIEMSHQVRRQDAAAAREQQTAHQRDPDKQAVSPYPGHNKPGALEVGRSMSAYY